jgi:YVTN family beta-propeller protein
VRPRYLFVFALAFVLSACRTPPETSDTAAGGAQPTAGGELVVLSNSSPHVSVIDTATTQVVRTADIPDFTGWAWNDDNNHLSGSELWLGMRDPDTDAVEVIALDLDTLEVAHRFDLGTDKLTLYIGKAASNGVLHVGKMDSGQVAVIDTGSYELVDTWEVPTAGDVVCDADISVDAQGVERFVYPTRKGDTVVAIDPQTGETLRIVETPAGAEPLMLTTGPDGRIWVQETGSNTNAVLDPATLEVLNRFPTAKGPIVNTFSPDGRLTYIGHSEDPIVQVVDTATYEEVARITVGTNPSKIAVHPGGDLIYPILTEEGAVAVVDTSTWDVTERIPLGTNPSGIFMRP